MGRKDIFITQIGGKSRRVSPKSEIRRDAENHLRKTTSPGFPNAFRSHGDVPSPNPIGPPRHFKYSCKIVWCRAGLHIPALHMFDFDGSCRMFRILRDPLEWADSVDSLLTP